MIPHTEALTDTQTGWTLNRNGQRIVCTLTPVSFGVCLLQITHNGHPFLDKVCDGASDALSQSLEAFSALSDRADG